MKKLLSVLLILGFFSLNLQAQNSGNLKKDAAEAAKTLCSCITNLMDELHPGIKTYVKDMYEMGEEEANKKFMVYLEGLSSAEQQQIMTDGERMSNFEAEMANLGCNDIENLYREYDGNKEFEAAILSYLKAHKECEWAFIFMQLGK